jgi:phosphatidylserine/phosphatidylglycerophosphate/cardiolipin synthase-like enzyme
VGLRVAVWVLVLAMVLPAAGPAIAGELPQGWRVLFSDAGFNDDAGMVGELRALLESAEQEISAHFYNLSDYGVIDSFVAAAEQLPPGSVRVIVDERNYTSSLAETFAAAGINLIHEDYCPDHPPSWSSEIESHNKFCVVDRRIVWTGSYNPSYRGASSQSQNVVVVESPALAEVYLEEFDRMWGGSGFEPDCERSRFGAGKEEDPAGYELVAAGVPVRVGFSPGGGNRDAIRERIAAAEHTIHFAIYTFTDYVIANAMMNMARDYGVEVKGVFDAGNAEYPTSQYPRMRDSEWADVRVHTSVWPSAEILHHKFIVIDKGHPGATVITGSYNLTQAADGTNDENLLIIESAEVAARYEEEFERCFYGASPTGEPALDLRLNQEVFAGGDDMTLTAFVLNPGDTREVDLYVILDLYTGADFYTWPGWAHNPWESGGGVPHETTLAIHRQRSTISVLDLRLPDPLPPAGPYAFWGMVSDVGGVEPLSGIEHCQFRFQ